MPPSPNKLKKEKPGASVVIPPAVFVPVAIAVFSGIIAGTYHLSIWNQSTPDIKDSMTDASKATLARLRQLDHFHWSVIPLFTSVLLIYAEYIGRGAWSQVLSALALLGMDLINEVANGLILHFTEYSALWTTPGDSTFTILIGWNIEILCMFATGGLILTNILPKDKDMVILGVNNRWLFAVGISLFSVFVEVLLNRWDQLIWEYTFWHVTNPFLIVVFGYLHFFIVCFKVYDMERASQVFYTALIWAIGLSGFVVFKFVLGWI